MANKNRAQLFFHVVVVAEGSMAKKAATYESVAAALGVPPSTVRYWARNHAPIASGDIPRIRRWVENWRATNPAKGGARSEAESSQIQRLQLARAAVELKERQAKATIAEIRCKKLAGELVPLEQVEQEFRELGETVKRQLASLPRQLAAELVGLTAGEIEKKIRAAISHRLRSLQERHK